MTNSERDARALTEEIERATTDQASDGIVGNGTMSSAEVVGVGTATEASEKNFNSEEQRSQRARLGNVATGLPAEGEVGTRAGGLLNEQLGNFDDHSDDFEAVEGAWNERSGEVANDFAINDQELARDRRELAEDEQELTEADNFVGAESRQQVEERLRDDYADYLTEIREGSPRDFRIMTANAERLTDETVATVNNLIKAEAVHPAKLARLKHKMTVALLKDAYGRNFGDRN